MRNAPFFAKGVFFCLIVATGRAYPIGMTDSSVNNTRRGRLSSTVQDLLDEDPAALRIAAEQIDLNGKEPDDPPLQMMADVFWGRRSVFFVKKTEAQFKRSLWFQTLAAFLIFPPVGLLLAIFNFIGGIKPRVTRLTFFGAVAFALMLLSLSKAVYGGCTAVDNGPGKMMTADCSQAPNSEPIRI